MKKFIGIDNESGSLCWMISYLQILYHIPVYQDVWRIHYCECIFLKFIKNLNFNDSMKVHSSLKKLFLNLSEMKKLVNFCN
jgi:hypothetical protein